MLWRPRHGSDSMPAARASGDAAEAVVAAVGRTLEGTDVLENGAGARLVGEAVELGSMREPRGSRDKMEVRCSSGEQGSEKRTLFSRHVRRWWSRRWVGR